MFNKPRSVISTYFFKQHQSLTINRYDRNRVLLARAPRRSNIINALALHSLTASGGASFYLLPCCPSVPPPGAFVCPALLMPWFCQPYIGIPQLWFQKGRNAARWIDRDWLFCLGCDHAFLKLQRKNGCWPNTIELFDYSPLTVERPTIQARTRKEFFVPVLKETD